MSSLGKTDIFAFSAIIILLLIIFFVHNNQIRFIAYVLVSILLVWRTIVYIQNAIQLAESF